MPNGSHAEADIAEQLEEVDEATAAKRQLLIKAAPLAGVWGLERFGLADVTVLKLLEALPGENVLRTVLAVCQSCVRSQLGLWNANRDYEVECISCNTGEWTFRQLRSCCIIYGAVVLLP